jgi:hypothetical protein
MPRASTALGTPDPGAGAGRGRTREDADVVNCRSRKRLRLRNDDSTRVGRVGAIVALVIAVMCGTIPAVRAMCDETVSGHSQSGYRG